MYRKNFKLFTLCYPVVCSPVTKIAIYPYFTLSKTHFVFSVGHRAAVCPSVNWMSSGLTDLLTTKESYKLTKHNTAACCELQGIRVKVLRFASVFATAMIFTTRCLTTTENKVYWSDTGAFTYRADSQSWNGFKVINKHIFRQGQTSLKQQLNDNEEKVTFRFTG